jgi:hypothetical protein
LSPHVANGPASPSWLVSAAPPHPAKDQSATNITPLETPNVLTEHPRGGCWSRCDPCVNRSVPARCISEGRKWTSATLAAGDVMVLRVENRMAADLAGGRVNRHVTPKAGGWGNGLAGLVTLHVKAIIPDVPGHISGRR